jgi:dipeptidyl aminopeptidase/acylaminoacyl peptidase
MSKSRFIVSLTWLALFELLLVLGCDSTAQQITKQEDRIVEFKGRQIDLKPYVEGFPYKSYMPVLKAGKMYYFQTGETDQLTEISLNAADINLANGRVLSKINFAERNVWDMRYREQDAHLYWIGDERNDEIVNLFGLNTQTGDLEMLTDVPYIFGWRWNPDETQVAYAVRLGDKDERLSELRLLNLKTGDDAAILEDTAEMRFTWGDPSWQPDGEGVVLVATANADRTYGNLVYVPLSDIPDQAIILTDPSQERQFPTPLKEWLNKDEFLFISNESGFANLYRYNIRTHVQTPVTILEEDLRSVEPLEINGEKRVLAVIQRPAENELLLLNPGTGDILLREVITKNISILDEHEGKMLVYATSASTPFEIDALTIADSTFHLTRKITLPSSLQGQIIHARVERVEFPTFDIDPATGRPRLIHAFLYQPKNPLPEGERVAMITSFYGGRNDFSKRIQILCQAGIHVFSPAPRGSTGFGRKFAALNDKDLGGNEIIDIIYAGQYLSQRLSISPARIGLYGTSHGGYATIRLLTFPGEVNDIQANFEWGFGISHAGFSNIVRFYEMSNIPDWVTLEAGDPKTEYDKLMDRSPITHADKLKGRLLLIHGSNDSRVPVIESRSLAAKLDSLGKLVRYVEFEGQGHGIKGLENTVRFYRTWFQFLSGI